MRRVAGILQWWALFAATTIPGASLAQPVGRPKIIDAMENSRAALVTGDVVYSAETFRRSPVDGARYFLEGGRVHRARFAEDEFLEEDCGDREGVVNRDSQGTPNPDVATRHNHILLYDGHQWQNETGGRLAELYRNRNNRIIDARTFGLSANLPRGHHFRRALLSEPNVRWDVERTVEGLYRVIRQDPENGWMTNYLVDPERGYNAVEITVSKSGKLQHSMKAQLKDFDGVWFPERVEYFEHDFEDGKKPVHVIEVQSASFNQPDHPRRLTPEDAGIEIGTTIQVLDENGNITEHLGWDGEKLAPHDEVMARVKRGELQLGPTYLKDVQRSLARGRTIDSFINEWEQYTHRFIERYKLDDGQRERAKTILNDCLDRARHHMTRVKRDFDAVRAEVDKVLDLEGVPPEMLKERLTPQREKMYKLLGPIWKIRYKELVPRLDKLPTRAQRAAVEDAEK